MAFSNGPSLRSNAILGEREAPSQIAVSETRSEHAAPHRQNNSLTSLTALNSACLKNVLIWDDYATFAVDTCCPHLAEMAVPRQSESPSPDVSEILPEMITPASRQGQFEKSGLLGKPLVGHASQSVRSSPV